MKKEIRKKTIDQILEISFDKHTVNVIDFNAIS